ncbi:MAG: DUF2300 domain-containing protein [Betaproteobacteria bacterium]|nr:DUF2300 domain-containing protein [Betaproteobacteria bacterium]
MQATLASAGSAPIPALEMLWRARGDGGLEWRAFDNAGHPITSERIPDPPAGEAANNNGGPFAQRVPLGSIWKLFVYLWLIEQRHPAPDYVCTGARSQRKEETYCCGTSQVIGRELALVRSCGLFFEPRRLGISPEAWRAFWETRPGVRDAAPWLADLGAMKPETEVSPASILYALEAAPARAREEAAGILLARLFAASPSGPEATELVRGMGGRLRVKSFSWHRPGQAARRYGGGAGWFTDGRPVWFAGEGSGQQVIARHGARLAKALAETLPPDSGLVTPGCVRVNFFVRYPFELEQPGGKSAREGILQGRFVARFQNGVSIPFTSSGELSFSRLNGRAHIEGRFGLDDYVARVIDREADAKETEAARALSVVIRSYLINEAARQGNCFVIDDSSRRQRVSIHSPSPEARAVAGFTAGLALLGTPVGYHGTTPSENRMAWKDAVSASRSGEAWDTILQKNFPKSNLGAMNDPAGLPCQRFTEAENWLASRAPRWHRTLYQHLPGFNEPAVPPDICLLAHGTPFSEQDRGRIHVRGLRSNEDRITLAHEYLHLGLRHHPSSYDEGLIEHWARKLVVESMP